MRLLFRRLSPTIIVIVAVWLQLGWVRIWPIGSSAVNLVIVAVIFVALFRSWSQLLWVASLAGLLLAQYTVWPVVIYPVAFVGMVVAVRLIVQRWVAARSTASLITAIAAATMVFYGLVAVLVTSYRVFYQTTLGIVWPDLILMTVVQSILHPLIVFVIWRRLTGGSFSTPAAVENVRSPF